MSLELWDPEGRVQCKVKFDVADVACPVVSLRKMIESDFTFSFDDYKCYMLKDNQRVEIFRMGRIFVLRMRRRRMESKIQMNTFIDEMTEGEMQMDDDGEGAGEARADSRADDSGDESAPPPPREVRSKFNTIRDRSCTSTQFDTLSISVLIRDVCDIERQK